MAEEQSENETTIPPAPDFKPHPDEDEKPEAVEESGASDSEGEESTEEETAEEEPEQEEPAEEEPAEETAGDEPAEEADEEPAAEETAGDELAEEADEELVAEEESSEEAAADVSDEETSEESPEDDVVEESEPSEDEATESEPSEETPKKKGRLLRKTLIIIAAAICILLVGSCIALAIDDTIRIQHVPENTTLDGSVDISGMTREELSELIIDRANNKVDTTVYLQVGDRNYEFDMSDVGAIDVDGTIDQAYSPYQDNILVRVVERVFEIAGNPIASHNVSLRCTTDADRLNKRISDIAEDAYAAPKNAAYVYDEPTNALVVAPATTGLEVKVDETNKIVQDAVENVSSGDADRLTLEAATIVTDPESTEPGQGIFVDTRNCRTQLYENGAVVASYANSPGTSGYRTPRGDFYLDYKDPAPVWINPHSDWSEGMEEEIAPGPSNPLGLRALAVSCGGGIFLHGTTSTGALGRPASHGCVRHSNNDIIDLYDRVSEGIPIIIR